jgi:hypothetical protein
VLVNVVGKLAQRFILVNSGVTDIAVIVEICCVVTCLFCRCVADLAFHESLCETHSNCQVNFAGAANYSAEKQFR